MDTILKYLKNKTLLAEFGRTPSDGVVKNLTDFTASTYISGIYFLQISTGLKAQVNFSISQWDNGC
ncbi:hypothetical protein [Enterococcus termitis]|uniref:hypothetical protein n=1 Tax=Enterococcus termitis TaxID=332950 RepID=UPI003CCC2A9F